MGPRATGQHKFELWNWPQDVGRGEHGAGWGWGCHQSALNVQAPTSALPTVTKPTAKPTPWSQGVSVEVASAAERKPACGGQDC